MKIRLLFLSVFLSLFAQAQNVNIPDANFKAYLIGNTSINTNADTEIQVSEASAFTGGINCSNMSISDLTGIEAFINLTYLECSGNQLTSLDVTGNILLTQLYCGNNLLTDLDVSQNTTLLVLSCNTNQLTDLETGNNPALQLLQANHNQLTALDVSQNTALTFLNCQNNQLTNLDIGNNMALEKLHVSGNQFTSIDLSGHPALTELSCDNNQLTSLNVANGNNQNFTWLTTTNNPNLTCIEVDDAAYSTANWTGSGFLFDPQSDFSENCNVYIPDANFKAYLVAQPQININGDPEIQFGEAAAYTGPVWCGNLGISDLTGIEAFANITDLQAPNNSLTSVNLNNNTALEYLYLFNNQINTIDLSNNMALTQLTLYGNQLASVDVSHNATLTVLLLDNNQLASIDVSNNPALIGLSLNDNQLSSVDFSNNAALYQLTVHNNPLTSLDLSHNPALANLYCANTQITDLDLSNNPVLTMLVAHGSHLTSLDLSNNPALTQITCNDNNLASLNLANGNNTAFIGIHAFNNPDLTCIEVDDADYSTANWTSSNFQFDSWMAFSEDCDMGTNDFADDVIEMYPNPAGSFVKLNGLPQNSLIRIFDLSGKIIYQRFAAARITIDTSGLTTGIYIVQIEGGGKTIRKKLVIGKFD